MQIIIAYIDQISESLICYHITAVKNKKIKFYRYYDYFQESDFDREQSQQLFRFHPKHNDWLQIFWEDGIEKIQKAIETYKQEYNSQIEYAMAQGEVFRKRRQAIEKINKG